MEIFNFFRIFVSNLQIKLSVNSVILMNSVTITAPLPAYLLWSSRLALGCPWLRAGTACTLRVDSARSWMCYKARNAVVALSFPARFPDVAASTPASSPRFLSPNQPRKSGVTTPSRPSEPIPTTVVVWVQREPPLATLLPRGRRSRPKLWFTAASIIW